MAVKVKGQGHIHTLLFDLQNHLRYITM